MGSAVAAAGCTAAGAGASSAIAGVARSSAVCACAMAAASAGSTRAAPSASCTDMGAAVAASFSMVCSIWAILGAGSPPPPSRRPAPQVAMVATSTAATAITRGLRSEPFWKRATRAAIALLEPSSPSPAMAASISSRVCCKARRAADTASGRTSASTCGASPSAICAFCCSSRARAWRTISSMSAGSAAGPANSGATGATGVADASMAPSRWAVGSSEGASTGSGASAPARSGAMTGASRGAVVACGRKPVSTAARWIGPAPAPSMRASAANAVSSARWSSPPAMAAAGAVMEVAGSP